MYVSFYNKTFDLNISKKILIIYITQQKCFNVLECLILVKISIVTTGTSA